MLLYSNQSLFNGWYIHSLSSYKYGLIRQRPLFSHEKCLAKKVVLQHQQHQAESAYRDDFSTLGHKVWSPCLKAEHSIGFTFAECTSRIKSKLDFLGAHSHSALPAPLLSHSSTFDFLFLESIPHSCTIGIQRSGSAHRTFDKKQLF